MLYNLQELEQISIAKDDQGYKNILKALDQELSFTEEEMQTLSDEINEKKALPYWKALKKIIFILKNYPETIAIELENYRKSLLKEGMEDFLLRTPSESQIKNLQAIYDSMKKKNQEEVV